MYKQLQNGNLCTSLSLSSRRASVHATALLKTLNIKNTGKQMKEAATKTKLE